MKKQKKILIVFPDRHLAYSPTTLNLKKKLSEHHSIKILAFRDPKFKELDSKDIVYLNSDQFLFKIFNFFARHLFQIKKFDKRLILWQKVCVRSYLFLNNYDEFIAVDHRGLWFIDHIRTKKIHFLSLELIPSSDDFPFTYDLTKLASIIIQSEERLKYLSNSYRKEIFYIQNAPNALKNIGNDQNQKNKVIYAGTARLQFGINYCLDFIDAYPQYELTIQGRIEPDVNNLLKEKYSHLLNSKRIMINETYLSEEELIRLVGDHRISFCFYDLRFPEINNFNYWTAPSGKMFTAFAAGTPVIGSAISGLDPLTSFAAGIQIADYSPAEIKKAIDEIEKDFYNFRNNCFKAAEHFSFDNNVQKFIEFINTH
jgi:glycosyltransferase involved in cell wall biosynthesis